MLLPKDWGKLSHRKVWGKSTPYWTLQGSMCWHTSTHTHTPQSPQESGLSVVPGSKQQEGKYSQSCQLSPWHLPVAETASSPTESSSTRLQELTSTVMRAKIPNFPQFLPRLQLHPSLSHPKAGCMSKGGRNGVCWGLLVVVGFSPFFLPLCDWDSPQLG